ncbi:hypothetical protein SAY87_023145 [Trapa incisa]|uniref:chorismate mutase n=1 Tax=Trapa incisa TaxID=236973 RepID=A0AAN7K591_9MYRT|nr:hypothetical protein SAY87_023145 [Trapa incisa]
MAKEVSDTMTLETVRNSLIEQEDTIIYSLMDRANYPLNPKMYESSSLIPGYDGSLVKFMVMETEAVHAKCGRYENPEELPFFPANLPSSLVSSQEYPKILHPAASSININELIWDFYFKNVLPLIAAPGDDGNYGKSAASDLICLQALSRRIHYGKFVAEVKFIEAPQDYEPEIHSQDADALMKLLTFEDVEEMVKTRVEKKAAVYGQRVGLDDSKTDQKPKIDPGVVSRLYDEWVMPLTKKVQAIIQVGHYTHARSTDVDIRTRWKIDSPAAAGTPVSPPRAPHHGIGFVPRQPADRHHFPSSRHHFLDHPQAPAPAPSDLPPLPRPPRCTRTIGILSSGLDQLMALDIKLKVAFVGPSLLHHAVSCGDFDAVRKLIKQRNTILARLSHEKADSILHVAASSENPFDMAKLLVELVLGFRHTGMNTSDNGDGVDRSVDDAACIDNIRRSEAEESERGEARGDLKQLESLIHDGTISMFSDQYGLTANIKGHTEVVELLIRQGLDLECQDKEGHRPLHLAVEGGSVSTVQALIDRGADVNAAIRSGATPLYCYGRGSNLYMARVMGYGDIVRQLEESRAAALHRSASVSSQRDGAASLGGEGEKTLSRSWRRRSIKTSDWVRVIEEELKCAD